uniref:Uncharacterized protein n=1 Tax=Knipowitschia caucasica TaxID=637954 RepID=A0AAV2KVG5_KNICA
MGMFWVGVLREEPLQLSPGTLRHQGGPAALASAKCPGEGWDRAPPSVTVGNLAIREELLSLHSCFIIYLPDLGQQLLLSEAIRCHLDLSLHCSGADELEADSQQSASRLRY